MCAVVSSELKLSFALFCRHRPDLSLRRPVREEAGQSRRYLSAVADLVVACWTCWDLDLALKMVIKRMKTKMSTCWALAGVRSATKTRPEVSSRPEPRQWWCSHPRPDQTHKRRPSSRGWPLGWRPERTRPLASPVLWACSKLGSNRLEGCWLKAQNQRPSWRPPSHHFGRPSWRPSSTGSAWERARFRNRGAGCSHRAGPQVEQSRMSQPPMSAKCDHFRRQPVADGNLIQLAGQTWRCAKFHLFLLLDLILLSHLLLFASPRLHE